MQHTLFFKKRFCLLFETYFLVLRLIFFIDKIMSKRIRGLFKTSKGDAATIDKPKRDPPKVTWKHLWSSDEMKDALVESNFKKLPIEVMLEIFKYLNVNDLENVSLVCRSFKMIADQDEIWKLKTRCKFILFILFSLRKNNIL